MNKTAIIDGVERSYMFQYGLARSGMVEDTGLITLEEAEELWREYQPDIIKHWNSFECPQMCIWSECSSPTDYTKVFKEIDWRDCERVNGKFYRITRELIE